MYGKYFLAFFFPLKKNNNVKFLGSVYFIFVRLYLGSISQSMSQSLQPLSQTPVSLIAFQHQVVKFESFTPPPPKKKKQENTTSSFQTQKYFEIVNEFVRWHAGFNDLINVSATVSFL